MSSMNHLNCREFTKPTIFKWDYIWGIELKRGRYVWDGLFAPYKPFYSFTYSGQKVGVNSKTSTMTTTVSGKPTLI